MFNIKKQLVSATESGNFLAEVCKLYLLEKDERNGLSQALINLHNDREIDVIAEFQKLDNTDKVNDFFTTIRILEPILPSISSPVLDVMECVRHLTFEAGNDMVAESLVSPFIDFMSVDEKRPQEVLRIALATIDEQFDYIMPALLAGTKLNLKEYVLKAIELSKHSNILIQRRAIQALGRIEYIKNTELIVNAMTTLEFTIANRFDDLLFAFVLRSSYSLYKHNNDLEKRMVKIFRLILKHHDNQILHIASNILAFESDMPKPIVELLLNALIFTKPENIATLNNIDYGLKKFLENNDKEKVIHFLEKILLRESDITITQFGSVSIEIVCSMETFNHTVTRWLLSKKVRLGRSVADLLLSSNRQDYCLSVDDQQLIGLAEGVCLFLAKKACGWFFMHPVSAVSFIVSLIDKATEDERQEIANILLHPLLISYSGSGKKYLEDALANASETQIVIINDVLTRLEEYHKGLEAAWNTRELIPSVAQRETYHRYHDRLMQKSMEEAEKSSIFLNLINKQVILYGNKTINYFKPSSEQQATRQEMQLQKSSYSVEYPSIDHLDHTGLEYMLCNFKFEGCIS